jgi:prepilin-type N-terminal cleavage/methylation domain-containing protein
MRVSSVSGRRPGNRKGFTLIELLIVVAVIGILATVAIALYNDFSARARIAKAQADLRVLASAAATYQAHTGTPPPTLDDLTVAVVNPQGQSGGPFLGTVPSPPGGGSPAWGPAYTYVANANGTFTLTASGDGATITVP